MAVISTAFTSPVNPPGASPILTVDEIWAGMVSKARAPKEFVSQIETCEIVKEDADGQGLTRHVVFGASMGNQEVDEEVRLYKPMKVDFYVPSTRMRVENIISRAGGGDADLYLTYTFEIHYPDVETDSKQIEELVQKHQGMAAEVVPHSVEVVRKMKVEGRL